MGSSNDAATIAADRIVVGSAFCNSALLLTVVRTEARKLSPFVFSTSANRSLTAVLFIRADSVCGCGVVCGCVCGCAAWIMLLLSIF